jgi:hypothetical protein
MNTILYATIWAAMMLFVAGEAGKSSVERGRVPRWTWQASAAGIMLCIVHMAIVMAARYSWNHEEAARSTAAQAASVYGVNWQGSLYVNYLFVLIWLSETVWSAVSPRSYCSRSAAVAWTARLFYLVIIFNAIVVFVRPEARPLGVALVAVLVGSWLRRADAITFRRA